MGGWDEKKDRADQRSVVEEIANAILDAEDKAKDDDDDDDESLPLEQLIARKKFEAQRGLCREESIDIFLTWHSFGGMQRGLSPMEVMEMPAWLRIDFQYILSVISRLRRERKKQKKANKKRKAEMKHDSVLGLPGDDL